MTDLALIRQAICRELETISHYQELMGSAQDAELRELFEHAMNEEKAHVAVFMRHLRRLDAPQDAAFQEPAAAPSQPQRAWTVGSLLGIPPDHDPNGMETPGVLGF